MPWHSETKGNASASNNNSLEATMQEFISTTKTMLQERSALIKHQGNMLQTQGALLQSHNSSLQAVETQVGQITQALHVRPHENLPSNTEVTKSNEKDQCSALTLRSGKEINKEDKFGGKSVEDPTPSHVQKEPEVLEDSPIEEDKGEKLDDEKTEEQHVNTAASTAPQPTRDEVRPPPPFPQRLKKHKEDLQFQKFASMLDQFHINIPFLEAIDQVPSYAKFLKDIVTKKRKLESMETIVVASEYCAGRIDLPMKKKDPGSFIIPCSIGDHFMGNALCDLGSSVNLMPKAVFKKLGIEIERPTTIILQLADRSHVRPEGKVEDVIVKVGKFVFPVDFLILDCEVDDKAPIILGRPFLTTGWILIDCEKRGICHESGRSNHDNQCIQHTQIKDFEELSRENSEELEETQGEANQYKKAIGWTMADLKGINPTICMHKIILEECHSNSVEPQRRLNPAMKKVVMKEIIKWLDAGVIYPISDSTWVSLVQCVPKKGGITVVTNEENEILSTRMVTGWRICMDYRKLNKATKKDYFPLPFIDQMLDRLARKAFYRFLDGYSGYNQIATAPEDQEKTTFTCPYGETFNSCLGNLAKVLKRCEEVDLVLNWEKCHFMVNEGTVLGHKISSKGIEVDKAKVEVIEKLPPPTNVKGIRSFLGHVGFYRRFIKEFSKISKPLCNLLQQNQPFVFDGECQSAFEELKMELISAPVVVPPDWTSPFELMCDASNHAVGTALRHRRGKLCHVIYYASRTLNEAQVNYTTTEKELLAIVFAFEKFR
ncbi:hypothetical protein V6N12_031055 [Hibiscus sabdariffa]|uniref:Retrovirus-related Pol polyprotein from transposon 17.6 n=1 Tax=Hibiscus sabdariffa TaxID=183260 RepID=A0ABR2E7S2_9ROSI